jgi:ABC-type hemin transport system ATPase subunit
MHDLNAAARFCDQLLLLTDLGPEPVANGAPEEVLTESALTEAYNAPFKTDRHPATNDLLIRAVEPEASVS